jgi:hypothetical protein
VIRAFPAVGTLSAVAAFVLGLWVLVVVAAVLLAAGALVLGTVVWGCRAGGRLRDLDLRLFRFGLFWFSRESGHCAFGLGRRPSGWRRFDRRDDWPDQGGVREPRRPTGSGPRNGSVSLDPHN